MITATEKGRERIAAVQRLLGVFTLSEPEIDRALGIMRQRLFKSEQVLNTHQEDALARESARYLVATLRDRHEIEDLIERRA